MSNSHIFLKSGFIRAPLQNGVGRYVCQLQRVVFKFCKNHAASRGVRDFIESDLINFAREQPGVAVYVKPRRHRSPVIVGEYLNGERKWFSLHNKDRSEVAGWLNNLMGAQGVDGMRFRKPWATAHPSVQGPWMPSHNIIEGTRPTNTYKSPAMEKLKALAREQGLKTIEE